MLRLYVEGRMHDWERGKERKRKEKMRAKRVRVC